MPAAAQGGMSAIRHHSPLQPFVHRSLGWIITGDSTYFRTLSSPRGVSSQPDQPHAHIIFQRGTVSPVRCSLPQHFQGLEPEYEHIPMRQDEKASHFIYYKYWMLHFLVLCHILEACSEGKLHLNILNRLSCQLWALPLFLCCKQIASRVTSVWIRLAHPCR